LAETLRRLFIHRLATGEKGGERQGQSKGAGHRRISPVLRRIANVEAR